MIVSVPVIGKKYPFYGVQWHPEVNRFQWAREANIPHSPHAVQLSARLSEFFVQEGEKTNTSSMIMISDSISGCFLVSEAEQVTLKPVRNYVKLLTQVISSFR